ncbi:unnamed protein product [Arabis nemorensis]|uniref:Transposase MuDR plant domain-containing protein n=1 Tax=Arabis nemorensis TaxID=586526 RepID=A0A565BIM4_9BRAS|nr:unnamed protein product [Arabis nemorensis]
MPKFVVGGDENVVDEKVPTKACDEHVEADEGDDCRFDYCDDPDGASSDDDEYGRYGRFADDEKLTENLPHKKRGVASIPKFVKLEMQSVDLAVGCWVEGCTWKVRASTIGQSPKFHVKTYVGKHSCSITERSRRARKATYQLLGRLYKDFIGGVGSSVLPSHIVEAITKGYRIKVEDIVMMVDLF